MESIPVKDLNESAFISLFKQVCFKCFGHQLTHPLSETDSKLLSNAILEQTGLVIGVKSIKNYSHYIFSSRERKQENPSTATLDTFARYILNAPYTDEIKRKDKESHFPWWFQYRNDFIKTVSVVRTVNERKILRTGAIIVAVIGIILIAIYYSKRDREAVFNDEFNALSRDSLKRNGWMVKNTESNYWNKRNNIPGELLLYTLIGDNWPLAGKNNEPSIKNLVFREIESSCFTAEVHFSNFIPIHSWQQAGILLSEDSTFKGKSLRLTIGYNDFFGGYRKPPEIIIQAVGSSENGDLSKPEEITHLTLFSGNPQADSLIRDNLSKSALKIEKKGNHYRFLFTNGSGKMESFAYKEAAKGEFNIEPRYVGIFAMQGYADVEHPMPVRVSSFSLIGIPCK